MKDEIYQVKDFSRENTRVLMRLDAGKLDENPVSQIFGTGPEVPLVTKYESHPIVSEMTNLFLGQEQVRDAA